MLNINVSLATIYGNIGRNLSHVQDVAAIMRNGSIMKNGKKKKKTKVEKWISSWPKWEQEAAKAILNKELSVLINEI
jgi:hypothetical protein